MDLKQCKAIRYDCIMPQMTAFKGRATFSIFNQCFLYLRRVHTKERNFLLLTGPFQYSHCDFNCLRFFCFGGWSEALLLRASLSEEIKKHGLLALSIENPSSFTLTVVLFALSSPIICAVKNIGDIIRSQETCKTDFTSSPSAE